MIKGSEAESIHTVEFSQEYDQGNILDVPFLLQERLSIDRLPIDFTCSSSEQTKADLDKGKTDVAKLDERHEENDEKPSEKEPEEMHEPEGKEEGEKCELSQMQRQSTRTSSAKKRHFDGEEKGGDTVEHEVVVSTTQDIGLDDELDAFMHSRGRGHSNKKARSWCVYTKPC